MFLLVTGRTVDHDEGTTSVTAVTFDQQVVNYRLVAAEADNSFRAVQSSVRAITEKVLADIGLGFVPSVNGTADADFTTLTNLTNYITNGAFEDSTVTGWTGSNATLTQVTAWAQSGTHSMQIGPSSTSSADSYALMTLTNLTPGSTYTCFGYEHLPATQNSTAATSTRSRAIVIVTTPTGGSASVLAQSAQPANAVGMYRVSVTFTVPANTASVQVRLYNGGQSGSTVTQWDNVMLVDGDGTETDGTALAYFDGDTPDTALYGYAWTGTNGASTSTRVPVFSRPPESLAWSPGQSAWDFLSPILTAVGLRLFCTDGADFFLVDNTYSEDGLVTLAVGRNLYSASSTLDRTQTAVDGSLMFFEAAVVTYTWTDQAGNTETAYDSYSAVDNPSNVLTVSYDKAYPGPGAAKYMVTRNMNRGYGLDLTARPDFRVTPSQQVSATVPGLDPQVGWVSSVTWSLAAAEMTVTTRGLISTPTTSWFFVAGQTWASSAGTSWAND
ncbi:hypothetical protein DEI93_07185 [Curtobacterium sp. MCBD17_035]|uniref:hypothetical protein n=1 Tax=Curtobacterium sp. MCBD17_035 TaxID=2175673 RepID=UPI0024E03E62|nr:hypothetical protein [Curtobacterium sp. MCBD17_035]WIB68805.1 hypothetical protein DEI93_07185 [Curtobacterium sp. MCBD17_035]